MPKRFRLVISLGLCLAAGLSTWLIVRPYRVSWALSEQMRRGPGTVVDFAALAPFAWDRVHVFGPYTTKECVHSCLGFDWDGVERTRIGYGKGVNLVVFVHRMAVVHWFDHERREELGALADPRGYARDQVRFTVYLHGVEQRLALAPPQE
jgi:hypothetical protein